MEIWKPVPELKGYEASSKGHIRSRRNSPPRILKIWTRRRSGRKPYDVVNIFRNKKKVSLKVSSLICLTFHGPPPRKNMGVMRLDRDSTNFRPNNLRWASWSEINNRDKPLGRQSCVICFVPLPVGRVSVYCGEHALAYKKALAKGQGQKWLASNSKSRISRMRYSGKAYPNEAAASIKRYIFDVNPPTAEECYTKCGISPTQWYTWVRSYRKTHGVPAASLEDRQRRIQRPRKKKSIKKATGKQMTIARKRKIIENIRSVKNEDLESLGSIVGRFSNEYGVTERTIYRWMASL